MPEKRNLHFRNSGTIFPENKNTAPAAGREGNPMQTERVLIYDTTLRDGSQGEGISFSKNDKLRIAECLDRFGVAYVEGGWPGANPKDTAFFREIRRRNLKNTRISAFGSTRRAGISAENDENLRKLLEAETPVVTIFGKSWLLHVRNVLKTSPDENLAMIRESCEFLKQHGREVIFDAEHFFDGYRDDPEYAASVLKAAVRGGATTLTLCDTNGGTMPLEIHSACSEIRKLLPEEIILGIHAHNDSGLAVANAITGVRAGCRQVQGTINGIGERCGNANLCSIIANLELKTNYRCLPPGNLVQLQSVGSFVDDIANLRHDRHAPFIGDSAFAHKGGMHVNAVAKEPRTFEHVNPESVGNQRRILVSDLSGKSNLQIKAAELGIRPPEPEELPRLLEILKKRENEGYEYEAADASFAVLLQKTLRQWGHYFQLEGFRVIIEKRHQGRTTISEATVKVSVNGVSELTAAEGEGPVNALDLALRKSLERFYPQLRGISLADFKVRILDSKVGTAAKTRVLIDSTDGHSTWGTVGVDENIIQASWEALVDSVEYALYRMNIQPISTDRKRKKSPVEPPAGGTGA